MFKSSLYKAFNDYVFDRMDDVLDRADKRDKDCMHFNEEFYKMQRRLVEISRQLKNEELRSLANKLESLVNMERGLSAEWAYKEGLRDSYRIQREVSKFLASPSVAAKRKTRERQ
jgi:hypothetical protein